MRYLLDVNVLVALAIPTHEFHERAHAWFRRERNRLWATCALTQAGFVRVASRELGGALDDVRKALAVLEQDCLSPQHEYWALDVDLRTLSNSQRARLIGPKQITDMQLLMLAHRQRGQLATFDNGIKELAAGTRHEGSMTILFPD